MNSQKPFLAIVMAGNEGVTFFFQAKNQADAEAYLRGLLDDKPGLLAGLFDPETGNQLAGSDLGIEVTVEHHAPQAPRPNHPGSGAIN